MSRTYKHHHTLIKLVLTDQLGYKKINLMQSRLEELDQHLEDISVLFKEDPSYWKTQIPFLSLKDIQALQTLEEYDSIASRILEWCFDYRISILSEKEALYPKRLKAFENKSYPPLLFAWGNAELQYMPSVGIIGSREASKQGRIIAHKVSKQISDAGFCIVSGFAVGIDQEAHFGAIHGDSGSIFVLSYPIHQFPQHILSELLEYPEKIWLLSEFLPLTPRDKQAPLVRNQTLAYLSDSLLVVEAGKHSGTMATTRICGKLKKRILTIDFGKDNPEGNQILINGESQKDLDVLVYKADSILTHPPTNWDEILLNPDSETFMNNEVEYNANTVKTNGLNLF